MTIILPLPTGHFNAKTREYKIMLKPGPKRELHGRKCKGENWAGWFPGTMSRKPIHEILA